MNTNSQKNWIFLLLCWGSAAISFNVAAIIAVIPVMSRDLGLSDLSLSQIISFYMIPYGIGALFYAPLTKRFSYKSVLAWTMAIYGITSFFCGLWPSFLMLIGGEIVLGITAASIIPLGLMLIGEIYDKKIRGRLVGIFFGVSFVASLAGIIMSGFVNWRWLFYVPGFMALLLFIGCLWPKCALMKRTHAMNTNYLKLFKRSAIRDVFFFIVCISVFYHSISKWFGVYLNQIYDMNQFQISLFFMAIAIASFIGQLLGGYISDKVNRIMACYVGCWGLGISAMMLIGHYSIWALFLILMVFSMSWTIGHNGVSTVLTDFPEADRPAVSSLNSALRFVSGGIGFFASRIFVAKSFELTFFVIGCLILILSLYIKNINK